MDQEIEENHLHRMRIIFKIQSYYDQIKNKFEVNFI